MLLFKNRPFPVELQHAELSLSSPCGVRDLTEFCPLLFSIRELAPASGCPAVNRKTKAVGKAPTLDAKGQELPYTAHAGPFLFDEAKGKRVSVNHPVTRFDGSDNRVDKSEDQKKRQENNTDYYKQRERGNDRVNDDGDLKIDHFFSCGIEKGILIFLTSQRMSGAMTLPKGMPRNPTKPNRWQRVPMV